MMTRNCTNCGTGIGPGINFCPNCGTAAPAEAAAVAEQAPPAAQQAPVPTDPQQQAGRSPFSTPGPIADTGGGPVWTPPAGGSPLASGGGGGMGTSGKIAAAVGAVVLLGGVAAGAKFLTSKKEERTPGPVATFGPAPAPTSSGLAPAISAPPPAPTSAPPPVEPTAEPDPAPDSGSLTDIIPSEVGKWVATDAQAAPDIAGNWGANDAIVVTYVKPNGAQLGAIFAAYSSAEDAYATVDPLGESLTGSGYTITDSFDLTLDSGEVIGRVAYLVGEDIIIFWSNGPFLISVEGAQGLPEEFFKQAPI